MKARIPFILIILMLFTKNMEAQKIGANNMLWQKNGLVVGIPGQKMIGLAGAISGISNNKLLIAGGNNFPGSAPWAGGRKKYYSDIYVFSKEADGFLQHPGKWNLPAALAYAAVCTTGLGIVYAGGENEQGISNKAGLLQWDSASNKIHILLLPDLPLAITNAAAAAHGNQVYIAGGETINGVSNLFFTIDISNSSEGWKQLPVMPVHLSHSLVLVQSNGEHDCLYLLGGRRKKSNGISDLYATVFSFDLVSRQWHRNKPLPYALSAACGIPARGNNIFIFGGDKGETFHHTEKLLAAIARETSPVRKQLMNRERIALQSTHPGFSRTVLQYNTVTMQASVTDTIPFEVPVTTQAIVWGNDIVIPAGEIKAGVRTAGIITGHFNNQP